MEMKFKVGDRVKDVLRNVEGVVESVSYDKFDDDHSVLVCFVTGDCTSYRQDGTELDSGVRLVHIDRPAPVLTEWQRKRIEETFTSAVLTTIESILSEPEPPKYIPKHGDAIRLRDRESDPWLVDVFDKMINDGRDYLGFNMSGKYCIPFDLIGTTDNP